MEKNIFKKITSIWVILTLIFILPMNINFIFAETATNAQIGTVCGGGTINVKDSLLMSVVTMCIPGILEKTNEWKEIKCETAVCYYDALKNDLDPTFCIKQGSYRTCSYIVGDIFALPGLNVFDYYRKKLADILANPVGTALSLATKAARSITTGSCLGPQAIVTCDFINIPYGAAATYIVIVDTASLIQQIKYLRNNGFFPSLKPQSSCERLPEIKKEMEDILKNT